MKTVADPRVLASLVERLRALGPDSARRWGTLTPHEMLCHLGDATDMVLRIRPRTAPLPMRRRPLMRLFWLWLPVPLPRGVKTNPQHDPRAGGTRPSDFARDRARAISGLEAVAAAEPDSLEPMHGIFGAMTVRDWQRWAWRHTDYHLRQFGA
jgi:hypothetical protein